MFAKPSHAPAGVSIAGIEVLEAETALSSATLSEALLPAVRHLLPPALQDPTFLQQLTGIRERRMWAERHHTPSQAAARVADRLLTRLGIPRNEVTLVISCSVTRDFIEPSVAALVHGELGLPDTCQCFDLSNACVGMVNGIDVATQMIASGRVDNALIVCAENTHDLIDGALRGLGTGTPDAALFESLLPGLTLGCGAVAVWLTRDAGAPGALRVVGAASLAATSQGRNRLCTAQRGLITTQSRGLLRHGLALAARTLVRLEATRGIRREQFDLFVCHQVSETHAQGVAKVWGMPFERFHHIYPTHGNMGPVAVIYCLHEAARAGRLPQHSQVLLGGIGSGLNCTLMHLSA